MRPLLKTRPQFYFRDFTESFVLIGSGDAAEALDCSNHIPVVPEAAAVGSTNGTSGASSAERSRDKEVESGVGLSLEETK